MLPVVTPRSPSGAHKVSTVIESEQYSQTNGTVVDGAPVETKKVVH